MRDLVSDKNLLYQLKAFSRKQINAFFPCFCEGGCWYGINYV